MKRILLFAFGLLAANDLRAELKLPAIIGDHMVLQQKQNDPIWGWDTPGAKITVGFAGQTYSTQAGADGKWMVKLTPMPANATPQILNITGTTTREIHDVLVGEVWVCSGQSNMQFPLWNPGGFGGDYNGDLEAAESNLPNLRLITVPNVGTQELQDTFQGEWQASTPATASKFSAVGFLYGRYLHRILGVPVGLIDNAWGGSAAEAWIRRSALAQDSRFNQLMAAAVQQEAFCQTEKASQDYAAALAKWKVAATKARAQLIPPPYAPQSPTNWLAGNKRPGNIFNGVLHPIIGYGIKGVIWYQGESNADHAYEYASLFPFLIEQWRQEWAQGDFPFYWVQLAGFKDVQPFPKESAWAELREAQTKTMQVTNTGQAVIIDLGEGKDVHPKNKHDVAARLVRWPLVKDYGMKLPFRSPEFKMLTVNSNKLLIEYDCFGSKLRPFGTYELKGFAVCGKDKIWHWAKGKIVGDNKVELSCDEVPAPDAVRYAWADNPVCNLFSNEGLPVTPFRTDAFELSTKPAKN